MSINNPIDQLFYQILCDLSQDVINDTQAAADETIDLSSHFLNAESMTLVDNFHTLCSNDSYDSSNKKNYTTKDYSKQLKIVKHNIKQVNKKNASIRAEVNIVLSAMQFSELLRQHLVGLQGSFATMINANTLNIDNIKRRMQEDMHTYDERKAFHKHVMHEEMPSEDLEITQDLIDQMIG